MTGPKVAAAPRNISASARALADADARMTAAKDQFSRAALACLRGNLDAAVQVRTALSAVDQARAELRRIADEGEER